ncbi:MAG TPA: HNH endonuclease [Candidatus Elarobacter sp.]|jgi:5-methylcytosine-specific restriction endonuclease McrA|nr:HNH endonuclease [Candidatus Elarobacter sp.]
MSESSVLLLNSTYEPLGVVRLERAVRLLFQRKAEVVADDGRLVRSPTFAFPLPSIVRLLYYVARRRKKVALTKKNVLLRDDYRCTYCSARGNAGDMTVDHVVPRSRGGSSTWENLVACCTTCNGRKRDRTPDEARMPLRRLPREPHFIPWIVVRRHTLPGEWIKYLTLYGVSIEERAG